MIGDGVGYQNSYSQVVAMTPFWINEDAFIAPNARLIVTNSTQTGVNAGLLARKYFEGIDRILGAYGYYDNDEDSLNNRYSQFTVGAETLGQWWDLRANGYLQSGNTSNFVSALGVGGLPYYVGNNIAFAGQQLRDQSLVGRTSNSEFHYHHTRNGFEDTRVPMRTGPVQMIRGVIEAESKQLSATI